MRSLFAPLALAAVLAGPLAAQQARFLKIDITGKSILHHKQDQDGPSEVHIRVPVSMAKGALACAGESDVTINGKDHKHMKLDQLVKLLEEAKPGDLLLELTTDKGDLIKITVQ